MTNITIGKEGITEGIIQESEAQLERLKKVEIKMLKSFREFNDRKQASKQLAARLNAKIEKLVGGKLVLTRKH